MLCGKEVQYLLLANGILTFLLMLAVLSWEGSVDCWVVKCAVRIWAGSLSSYRLCQSIPAQLHLHFLLGFFSHPLLAMVVSYFDLFYLDYRGVVIKNRQSSSTESTNVGLNFALQLFLAKTCFSQLKSLSYFLTIYGSWHLMCCLVSSMCLTGWEMLQFICRNKSSVA